LFYNGVMVTVSQKRVSIVVPCYNEEEMLPAFLERTRAVCRDIEDHEFEFLFVNDGSTDASQATILDEAARDPRVKLVALSRNFGHQRAITAGLDFCTGDYVIVIDADLQDPPELIPKIIAKLEDGYDLVHLVREDRRVDSSWKRFSAQVFYAFMRRFVLTALPADAPDFKGFNRRVLAAFRQYGEHVRFLRGIFATLGFKQTSILYTRDVRYAGKSKYPLKKILALGRDAVLSYSVFPLHCSLFAGMLACLATALFAVGCLLYHFVGPGLREPLLLLLVGLVSGFGGAILVVLGIIGEYLGIIMNEAKQRPLYIVESVHNVTTPVRKD